MTSGPHAISADSKLSPAAYMRMVASVAAIAGGLYGYDTGIIAGALPLIARDFGLGYQAQELVAAMILLGAVIGSLSCTRMSGTLGRRRTIMIISVIYSFGVVAAALSPTVWSLVLSRLVLGFAVGGSTQIVPTYIAELAEPAKRGRLVTYFNVSIGIGILLAAIVGVAGNEMFDWRWMIGVAVVPSLILTFGMTKLPLSPRWLVEQDRIHDARTELSKVRDSRETVRRELADMQDIVAQQAHESTSGWRGLREPWVRPALVAGLGVAAFTQLTGIEMMIYYTPTFLRVRRFRRIGFPVGRAWRCRYLSDDDIHWQDGCRSCWTAHAESRHVTCCRGELAGLRRGSAFRPGGTYAAILGGRVPDRFHDFQFGRHPGDRLADGRGDLPVERSRPGDGCSCRDAVGLEPAADRQCTDDDEMAWRRRSDVGVRRA